VRWASFVLVLLAGCSWARDKKNTGTCADDRWEERCDGAMQALLGRPYCLRIPAGEGEKPLIIALHGYGASPGYAASALGVGDAQGVYLASPSGTPTARGHRFWNAFPACCGSSRDAPLPDDVAYLAALIADVKAKHAISAVYVIGHSNGGFMAHRFACERPDLVRGIASIAGTLELSRCAPQSPVTVIQVHGDRDRIIPYGGGTVFTSTSTFASADATVALWARAGACKSGPAIEAHADLVCESEAPGEETEVRRYHGCAGDTKVELWHMRGVPHVPRFDRKAFGARLIDALIH